MRLRPFGAAESRRTSASTPSEVSCIARTDEDSVCWAPARPPSDIEHGRGSEKGEQDRRCQVEDGLQAREPAWVGQL